MTREELREHCERQIQQFERVEKIMPITMNDLKRYEEHKLILELLEQESILDKIRTEMEQLPIKTRTNWDGCCPDIDYPQIEYVDVSKNKLLSIIDKYKAESEE